MKSLNFLDLISKYKSVSIIGMDKNVGKTTTLNYILENIRGVKTVGITSIGRDGEKEDLVTKTPKPRIYVQKGSYIALAKQCIFESDATFEISNVLDIDTPMGRIVTVKTLSDGYVEIAGPSITTQIRQITRILSELGADIVLVDGALSRKSFANPTITEAAILVSGAALSINMMEVVNRTINTVKLLTINEEEENIKKAYSKTMCDCKLAFFYNDGRTLKNFTKTVLGASKEVILNLNSNISHVFINGIVTDNFLINIMNSVQSLSGKTFVVEDGTKLFIKSEVLERFYKMGGQLKVLNKIKLEALSLNPFSPYGYEFEYEKMVCELRKEIEIPIFNIMNL